MISTLFRRKQGPAAAALRWVVLAGAALLLPALAKAQILPLEAGVPPVGIPAAWVLSGLPPEGPVVMTEVLRVALADRVDVRDFGRAERILRTVREMPGATPSQKCLAEYGQAEILLAEGRMEAVETALRVAADRAGIPPSLKLLCLLRMADVPLRRHRVPEALEWIDQSIAVRGADPKLTAEARWARARLLMFLKRSLEAIPELDLIFDTPTAFWETRSAALQQRTKLRRSLGRLAGELEAETKSLASPFITDFVRADLLLKRSALLLEMGKIQEAARDALTVIDSSWLLSAGPRSRAFTALGRIRLKSGSAAAALELGAQAAALPGTPPAEAADALMLRAQALHGLRQEAAAIGELGKAVDLAGASSQSTGEALMLRAQYWMERGLIRNSIQDLCRAADLPGISREMLARILASRALKYQKQGNLELLRPDALKVLEMPEADPEQKLMAAGGWALLEADQGHYMTARDVWGRLLAGTNLPDDRQEQFMSMQASLSLRANKLDTALQDVARVLQKPRLSMGCKVEVMMLRSEIYRRANRRVELMQSLTELIGLPGIPGKVLKMALEYRARAYDDLQQPEKAAADRARAAALTPPGK